MFLFWPWRKKILHLWLGHSHEKFSHKTLYFSPWGKKAQMLLPQGWNVQVLSYFTLEDCSGSKRTFRSDQSTNNSTKPITWFFSFVRFNAFWILINIREIIKLDFQIIKKILYLICILYIIYGKVVMLITLNYIVYIYIYYIT